MQRSRESCVLLVSDDPAVAEPAEAAVSERFDVLWSSRHERADTCLPAGLGRLVEDRRPAFLLSLLSPIIIPPPMLRAVERASINFHPAPPQYPGVGSCSYALYDQRETFGVTAHEIAEAVDAGRILAVRRFPILADDTCATLSARARHECLLLFLDVVDQLGAPGGLQPITAQWSRQAVTTKEFREWMTLDCDASADDVARMIGAVRHPRLPGPFVMVHGHRFAYAPQSREPEADGPVVGGGATSQGVGTEPS